MLLFAYLCAACIGLLKAGQVLWAWLMTVQIYLFVQSQPQALNSNDISILLMILLYSKIGIKCILISIILRSLIEKQVHLLLTNNQGRGVVSINEGVGRSGFEKFSLLAWRKRKLEHHLCF